jgi:hypothetical protein
VLQPWKIRKKTVESMALLFRESAVGGDRF